MTTLVDRIRQNALKDRKNKLGIQQLQAVYTNRKRPKSKKTQHDKQNKIKQSKKIEFPLFAVKFKSNQPTNCHNTSKAKPSKPPSARQTVKRTPQRQFDFTYEDSFCRRTSEPKKQQEPVQEINEERMQKYHRVLEKVFNGLDIFNRGKISQTNINKWIPESSLYFLGGVFQKIRQERLNLTKSEFIQLCIPVLHSSSKQDIKMFMDDLNGQGIRLDVSINLSSGQKTSSPVIERLMHRGNQKGNSDKKVSFDRNLSDLQMNNKLNTLKINQQLKQVSFNFSNPGQISLRTQNMKQKKASYRQQIDQLAQKIHMEQISAKKELTDKKVANSDTKVANSDNKKVYQENKAAYRPNQQQFSYRSNGENQPYIHSKGLNQVPQFSFTLQSRPETSKNIFQNVKIINQAYPKSIVSPVNDRYQIPCQMPSKTPRLIQQKVPRSPMISQRHLSTDSKHTQRIDKLSNRVEEYIRFNQEKIEKNKLFLRQNSAPKY